MVFIILFCNSLDNKNNLCTASMKTLTNYADSTESRSRIYVPAY
jgi:hypothetical protein